MKEYYLELILTLLFSLLHKDSINHIAFPLSISHPLFTLKKAGKASAFCASPGFCEY